MYCIRNLRHERNRGHKRNRRHHKRNRRHKHNDQQYGRFNWGGFVKTSFVIMFALFAGFILVYMLFPVVAQNNSRPYLHRVSVDEVAENLDKYAEPDGGWHIISCTDDYVGGGYARDMIECLGSRKQCQEIAAEMDTVREEVRKKNNHRADYEPLRCIIHKASKASKASKVSKVYKVSDGRLGVKGKHKYKIINKIINR